MEKFIKQCLRIVYLSIVGLVGILTLSHAQSADVFVSVIQESRTGDLCFDQCGVEFGALQVQSYQTYIGPVIIEYRLRECSSGGIEYNDIMLVRALYFTAMNTDPHVSATMSFAIDEISEFVIGRNPFDFTQSTYNCTKQYIRVFRPSCWYRENIGSQDCPVTYAPCMDPSPSNCGYTLYCTEFSAENVISGASIIHEFHAEACEVGTGVYTPPDYLNKCEAAYGPRIKL